MLREMVCMCILLGGVMKGLEDKYPFMGVEHASSWVDVNTYLPEGHTVRQHELVTA